MNYTRPYFELTVFGKYPNHCAYLDHVTNTVCMHPVVLWKVLPTNVESISTHIWKNGVVTKDVDGLFANSNSIFVPGPNTFSVCCTELYFRNTVKTKNINYLFLQHTVSRLSAYLPGSVLPTFDYTWDNGTITEDVDGLFSSNTNTVIPSGTSGMAYSASTGTYTYKITSVPSGAIFGVDPGFEYPPLTVSFPGTVIKCECGSDSVGSNRHSSYCPKEGK